jgi:hypothetical protein
MKNRHTVKTDKQTNRKNSQREREKQPIIIKNRHTKRNKQTEKKKNRNTQKKKNSQKVTKTANHIKK